MNVDSQRSRSTERPRRGRAGKIALKNHQAILFTYNIIFYILQIRIRLFLLQLALEPERAELMFLSVAWMPSGRQKQSQ